MRQWNLKGFTLIELLIVVAIIAILAAIAVPNFLEAQVRSKVSRARNDMRSITTALEAYFVDKNTYVRSRAEISSPRSGITVNSMLNPNAAGTATYGTAPSPGGAQHRITFATYNPNEPGMRGHSLTTPIAYMTTIPSDPFSNTRGAAFGYYNAMDAGFILWSYGPDTDENTENGQLQSWFWEFGMSNTGAYVLNSVYNPYTSNPTLYLETGLVDNVMYNLTYDGTNGTTSAGDVWRVKQ